MKKTKRSLSVNDVFKKYKNKSVLITGGLGFLGSSLARALVEQDAHVTIVDSLIPGYGGNLFNVDDIKDKITINISDVRDNYSMNHLVQDKDIMFNLAGTLSHVDSMSDPFTDLEINCVSQLSILEACRKHNPNIKIVWAGTRNQYGKAQYLPVDEQHPQVPTDVNGINNIAGEEYHLLYNRVYGIRACSLRLTNCYGPRHQMRHSRQGVLNWFIRQLIDGEEIKLYGEGKQIRDINYVDDVTHAFLLAGASERVWGEAFNLGGDAVSLEDFVKKAIEIFGKGTYSIIPFTKERKRIEIGDYVADYTKIKKQLGWKPIINIETGLKMTFDYYIKHKKHFW